MINIRVRRKSAVEPVDLRDPRIPGDP
jgi:hypothetical protein